MMMKKTTSRARQFSLGVLLALYGLLVQAAPTVSISSPTANTVFTAPASVAITASATPSTGTTITKVAFYQGSTLLGTATKSPYSVTWSSAPAGSYSLTAQATDSKGAVTTSAAVPIIVNAPPTVSLTSPTANSTFGAPATITLTATAADSDGSVAKVDFYQGSTLLGTATSSPYSVTWSNAAAGSYSLTAKATDNRGAVTTSTAVAVTVETAPTVSLTAPAANTVFTAPASVTLTASATAGKGTISKVDFYQGSTLLGTATKSPYSVTWSNAPAGSYSLTAKATDSQGVATTSTAVPIIVNAPPTVSLTSPAANTTLGAPATITLTANAADSDGTVAKVDFYQGSTLLGTATSSPYSVTWSNAAAGSYSLTAKATDNRGAVTTSAAVPVTVETGPTVAISTPSANTVFTAPGNVTISATATASAGTISKVDFYQGSTLIGTATSSPYSVTWSNAPAGSYSLTAKATDSQGVATTSAAVPIVVNAPPTVSLTGPVANTVFNVSASITLSATATASTGTIAKVDFYQGGTLIGTATSAPYSVTWSNAAAGSYSLTAKATDNRGAVTTSTAIPVVVETGPAVAISSPASNATYGAPATITVTASATASSGTIAKVDFYQGGTLIGTATSAPYSVTWSNAAAGNYSLTAKATDSQGIATTSTAVPIIVDTPPSVSLTSPVANTVFNVSASVTLSATATASTGTIAKVDFYQGGTLIGTATASPYSVTWSNAAAGSYSLTAKATDSQGIATTSTAVPIIVDGPPVVSLTSPAPNASFTAPGTITLTASASSTTGTISQVAFYQGGTLIGVRTASPYSLTWSDVPAGNYSLTAQATDNSGVSATSAAVAITVTSGGAAVYYLHNDHLNTPRMVMDEQNVVVWRNLPLNAYRSTQLNWHSLT